MALLEAATNRLLSSVLVAFCVIFSSASFAATRISALDARHSETESLPRIWFFLNRSSSIQRSFVEAHKNAASEMITSFAYSTGSKVFSQAKGFQSAETIVRTVARHNVRHPGITSHPAKGTIHADCLKGCSSGGSAVQKWDKLSHSLALSKKMKSQFRHSHSHVDRKLRSQTLKDFERDKVLKKNSNMVSNRLVPLRTRQKLKTAVQRRNLQREGSEISVEVVVGHGPFWSKEHFNRGPFPEVQRSLMEIGETKEREQIRKLVETLRKSGLFAAIAGVIESMNLWMLPQFVTMFMPTDTAYQTIKDVDVDRMALFQYHTIIQRYTFSQLCEFSEGTTLYTMRPGCTVVVTEKQNPFKITLDDVSVIAPDLYLDETVAVHGIDGIFNSTLYGRNFGGHMPGLSAPPPVDKPSNGTGKPTVPASAPSAGSSTPGKGAGASDQQGSPNQRGSDSGSDNTDPDTFHIPFSPLESETASDMDASYPTVPPSFGASCCAAFLCVLSILCC